MTKKKTASKEFVHGYPSDLLPMEEKDQKWCLNYIQTMDREYNQGSGTYLFRAKSEDYKEWRDYARGNQDIDQYKVLLNTKNNKGKKNLSYKNLDWTILPIAPKFKNLLVGKMIGQNNEIGLRAIDKRAVEGKRQKRLTLQEWMINQKFLANIQEKTGIGFETPLDDGAPPPESIKDLDIYMDMFYKERYCLEMQDLLKLHKETNNYEQILKECAEDLVEVGVGATRTYRVGKKLRTRKCVAERMITNNCRFEDFRDLKHAGEYWDLTIGELKEIVDPGTFSELDWQKIAEQAGGQSYGNEHQLAQYYEEYHSYPYDVLKVTVLDAVWRSTDDWGVQVKPKKGKAYRKGGNFLPEGVSEQDYNEKNDNQYHKRSLENWYQGLWFVNTNYIANWGLMSNMPRVASEIGRTLGPYMLYSLNFDSIMRQIIPALDSIQLNWLQYQHHVTKSRPAGLSIEYTALHDINIGGKAGKKMTPKEVLELYMETGIQLWKRKDWGGRDSNFMPISELGGGISEAAEFHWRKILETIDLLRNIIGVSEVADSSVPNPEIGKAVTEYAMGATQETLKYLYHAFDMINLGSSKRMIMQIPDLFAEGASPGYTEALGQNSIAFIAETSELTMHEYGVYLERGLSEKMEARIAMYIQNEITAGTFLSEEALEIENEPNVYRKIQLLKMYRRQKIEQKRLEMQQTYQAEEQKNVNSAKASSEAKINEKQKEYEFKDAYDERQMRRTITINREKTADQFLLEKFKKGSELTKLEKERVTKLMVEDKKGEWDIRLEKAKPKPQPVRALPAAKKAS